MDTIYLNLNCAIDSYFFVLTIRLYRITVTCTVVKQVRNTSNRDLIVCILMKQLDQGK